MGPGKDTHGTPMPERRPWVAHNTIHCATNVRNQKAVFGNIHGSGAVLSPVQLKTGSSSEQNVDALDKKLTDSLWAVASNRDTQGDTPGHSGQERGVDRQSPE